MIKYPIWFTCSLKCFQCLNVTGLFWAFLMEKWHLNIIRNFPTAGFHLLGRCCQCLMLSGPHQVVSLTGFDSPAWESVKTGRKPREGILHRLPFLIQS